jgi:UDP-N-acetylmuramoyl-tripeptide--D-alanyl-D-alanine ligase
MDEEKMKQELRIDRTIDLNQFVHIVIGTTSAKFSNPSTGICFDTRIIRPGDLFFAIQSERDGHEYAAQALEKGAAACVVSRDLGLKNQILVSDTLHALWNYSAWVRSQWGKSIVALSGSNGKTSTKEMMATLLGERTHKTPGTWNNFLGVPLTLLMLQSKHDYAVVEMGINHFGELEQLCKFTKPNIAVLTNVGPAHLMEFKDLDGVAKAKGEIFKLLQGSDIAVLNIDDPRIENMKSSIRAKTMTVSQKQTANIQLLSKKKQGSGYELELLYGKTKITVELPIRGEHNISNYLCSLGVASALGISPDKIQKRTKLIQQVQMRMQEIPLPKNRRIVNDCYNANLGSFNAALQTISEEQPERFLVLMGDILEMGDQAVQVHRDLGKLMAQYKVHHLFVAGEHANDAIEGALENGLSEEQITKIDKKDEAVQKILPYFNPGDILLVKGSRGMKLEEIISELEHDLKG